MSLMDRYWEEHNVRTEGQAGLNSLERLVRILGYGTGFMQNRAVEDFLLDNPGAIEAMLDFVAKHATPGSEWHTALTDVLPPEEEDDDDDDE